MAFDTFKLGKNELNSVETYFPSDVVHFFFDYHHSQFVGKKMKFTFEHSSTKTIFLECQHELAKLYQSQFPV